MGSADVREHHPMKSAFLRRVALAVALSLLAACSGPQVSDTKLPGKLDVRPDNGVAPLFTPPKPERFELANGLQVWLFSRTTLPLVTASLTLPAGAVVDPDGKAGLASLTASMLSEGTERLTSLEFADEVEVLGATLSASSGQDSSQVFLQTLPRNLEATLALASELLMTPRFDPKEFERIHQLTSNSLQQRQDEPKAVASITGTRAFFGEGHPYAHPVDGTLESLENLSLEDVKTFYSTYWRPEGATLVVVGDVDRKGLEGLLNEKLGTWQGKGPVPEIANPVAPTSLGRTVIVDVPGAPQTVIRFLMPGPGIRTPDAATLELLNTLFGGSFTSRINQNLREDKGYTYGARSSFVMLRSTGYFVGSSSVRTEVTGAALAEFLKEYRRLEAGDITADELERSRATQNADMVQLFETQSGVVSAFSDVALYGLGEDHLEKLLAALQVVQLPGLNDQARRASDLSNATLILVGDRAEIERQIAELPIAPAELRDKEGALLPRETEPTNP